MFCTCHYFSHVLNHNTEINVVIPTPEGNEQITATGKDMRYDYENGLPVVYLLHGAFGDNSSWSRFSSIERYAQAHNCIAVMAGVENSFYQDMARGGQYYTYMTKELPEYITRIFPASKKREDTFVAGFSMGGYGAWFLALSRPDIYSKAASMSGALDIVRLHDEAEAGLVDNPFPWEDAFGETAGHLEGSDRDLFALLKRDMENGQVPELYQSCGTEDFLYKLNQGVHEKLEKMGVKTVYKEVPGYMHNWEFWDLEIRSILDWMFSA